MASQCIPFSKGLGMSTCTAYFVNLLSVTTFPQTSTCTPHLLSTTPRCGLLLAAELDKQEVEVEHHYSRNAIHYWDKFYHRHKNKFFKDRHYLQKDWGQYFCDNDVNDTNSPKRKVVLEVGCGAGNTIFPLIAAYPNIFVHACDFSPQAVSLVKSHASFNNGYVNVFVCDVAKDDLCVNIKPSSVDIVTLIFVLSAVAPSKMTLVLQNLKRVLKPDGHILLRDYALGDAALVKLQNRNQIIDDNYCFGDGTCAFYFSEDFLSSLFERAGFSIVDISTYCRKIENRSKNIKILRNLNTCHFQPALSAPWDEVILVSSVVGVCALDLFIECILPTASELLPLALIVMFIDGISYCYQPTCNLLIGSKIYCPKLHKSSFDCQL